MKRSPPNLNIPSISWTVEQQDNLGYQEELQVDTNHSSLTQLETEAVMRELECPVCLSPMKAGIRQCLQGHCVCCSCVARGLLHCPLCRGEIQGRAVNMENIARVLFNTN